MDGFKLKREPTLHLERQFINGSAYQLFCIFVNANGTEIKLNILNKNSEIFIACKRLLSNYTVNPFFLIVMINFVCYFPNSQQKISLRI